MPATAYLVALEVRERLVTAAMDPSLREVALGAAATDTTARVQVVWRVVVIPLGGEQMEGEQNPPTDVEGARRWLATWAKTHASGDGRLAARSGGEPPNSDPCVISPDSTYRGLENQLYRIEIHDSSGDETEPPTFVWSRDNGSVVYPISQEQDMVVTVTSLRGPDRHELAVGDWVELFDDESVARGVRHPVVRVEKIERGVEGGASEVTLSDPPRGGQSEDAFPRQAVLRRWDHRDDTSVIPVSWDTELPLEDGIHVRFTQGRYRAGDHWLVPARTLTGAVEWPLTDDGLPALSPPLPAEAHYAPLALVRNDLPIKDLRVAFPRRSDD